MTPRCIAFSAGLLLALSAASPAVAQGRLPDAPQVTDVLPPSGTRGSSIEVTLAGQKLAGTKALMCRYSAFPDLIAPTPRGVTAEVTSSTDGQVKAKLTIAPTAPAGLHEIRACTEQGITPAAYFYVSQHTQVAEKEPNNAQAQAAAVTLPVTLAGVIQNGEDRDFYSFQAKKGERLVFDVEGFKRFAPPQNNQQGIVHLDSFLVLRDAAGRELAYDDDSSRLDAFLAYQFPADGRYVVSISDSTFRGRGDFHYRLTISGDPAITAVFPPGGQRGARLVATVYGYNLDSSGATQLRTSIPLQREAGAQEFRVTTSTGTSNAVPILVAASEDLPETEPNERIRDATRVQVPMSMSGMFHNVNDVDGYRFQGQGNQRIVAQVTASRLGSPVDSFLTLCDSSGKVLARDDDGAGMPDARLEATLPGTDEYVIFVRNQAKQGCGPTFFYRLTLRTPTPGFTVGYRQEGVNGQGQPTMVPVDSVTVPQGGTAEFQVQLRRYEGQGGDVGLALNVPPTVKGLTIEQVVRETVRMPGTPETTRTTIVRLAVVKNGQNEATLRIGAAPEMAPGFYTNNVWLRLSGTAGGQPYVIDQPLWLTVAPKS